MVVMSWRMSTYTTYIHLSNCARHASGSVTGGTPPEVMSIQRSCGTAFTCNALRRILGVPRCDPDRCAGSLIPSRFWDTVDQ